LSSESEFIALKDAAKVIASCFKPPFSKSDSTVENQEQDGPKRNIVLLGHDTSADINFMQQLGYDVHNLSNLLEIADTASMWRYLKRETNSRNLGMILYELDITSWHLHNAGNDAVYTLQVMIAIAIKHIEDKKRTKEDKEKDKKLRIAE
jgi:DNA polymerase III alpha subunit (gram-positive type)